MRTTRLTAYEWFKFIEFKTREELEEIYKKNLTVAIIFNNNTSERDNVSYTLTIPRKKFPFGINQTIGNPGMRSITKRNSKMILFYFSVNCRNKPFQREDTFKKKCPEMLYYTKGYTLVQQIIDSSIIRVNH